MPESHHVACQKVYCFIIHSKTMVILAIVTIFFLMIITYGIIMIITNIIDLTSMSETPIECGVAELSFRHVINSFDEIFVFIEIILIATVCSAPPATPPFDRGIFLNGNECSNQLEFSVFALWIASLVCMVVRWILLHYCYHNQRKNRDLTVNVATLGLITLPMSVFLLLMVTCIGMHAKRKMKTLLMNESGRTWCVLINSCSIQITSLVFITHLFPLAAYACTYALLVSDGTALLRRHMQLMFGILIHSIQMLCYVMDIRKYLMGLFGLDTEETNDSSTSIHVAPTCPPLRIVNPSIASESDTEWQCEGVVNDTRNQTNC
eukprot:284998_1